MRFAVIGAGPAGLWAALRLAESGHGVELIERNDRVGGNAGSFELAGQMVDLGSHRLHPSIDPFLLDRLRHMLGDDLLLRRRRGRIFLEGRWIDFPLRLPDLVLRLPRKFAAGVAFDLLRRAPTPTEDDEESFASVLERGLGPTMCDRFYFPYARKIWGLEPHQLSPEQARRRVSAGSIGRLLAKALPTRPGKKGQVPGRSFFYPRHGFGQIAEAIRHAAVEAGCNLSLATSVQTVNRTEDGGYDLRLVRGGAAAGSLNVDQVWSTIPAPALVRLLQPGPSSTVLDAAGSLQLRSMVLVYPVLPRRRFSPFDAHYFPSSEPVFSRISEPKNYTDSGDDLETTTLCAEFPCSPTDPIWSLSEDEAGRLVLDGLGRVGLDPGCDPLDCRVVRLDQAYPIYRRGCERAFDIVDGWLDGQKGLLTFGRQGLFAHDNTHHTLHMAEAAVRSLDDEGRLMEGPWREARRGFRSHVVED